MFSAKRIAKSPRVELFVRKEYWIIIYNINKWQNNDFMSSSKFYFEILAKSQSGNAKSIVILQMRLHLFLRNKTSTQNCTF